jgi:hypothetical protein
MVEDTYWNGERTPCRRVLVTVGKAPALTWWCAPYEGMIRQAVEVTYNGQIFFLDNEDNSGWNKVTNRQGSPRASHRSLPDDSEVINSKWLKSP